LSGIIFNGLFQSVDLFAPLRHAINSIFYLVLFGGAVSEQEIALFSLPTHFGGLGVANCVNAVPLAFQCSQECSSLLVSTIVNHGHVSHHHTHLDMVHSNVTRCREDQFHLVFSSVLSGMPFMTSCAVQCAVDFHISSSLNVLPLIHHHFDLSA